MSRSALTKVLRYNTKAYIEKLCVRKSKRGLPQKIRTSLVDDRLLFCSAQVFLDMGQQIGAFPP